MGRSDTGEHSISRRTDGRWHTRIELPSLDGKRKRKTIYGKTRKIVATKLKEALAHKEAGGNLEDERTTLAQFLEKWLELVKVNKSPRTHESYSITVKHYIIPSIGGVRLNKLSPQHILALRTFVLNMGLTRTTQYAHDVLKRALNVALKWGLVVRNVATLVETYKPPPRKKSIITPDIARRLLATVVGDRYEVLYRLTLTCGLRRGEVLALQWEDLDFDKGTLRVCASLQRYDGKLQRGEPKTRASVRVLQLPTALLELLRQHKTTHNGIYIFANAKGNATDPRTLIQQHFKVALAKAGLPEEIRFHDLRHAAATFMAMQGVPPKTAARVLGHADITTTLRIYTDTLPELDAEALEKVAQLF